MIRKATSVYELSFVYKKRKKKEKKGIAIKASEIRKFLAYVFIAIVFISVR